MDRKYTCGLSQPSRSCVDRDTPGSVWPHAIDRREARTWASVSDQMVRLLSCVEYRTQDRENQRLRYTGAWLFGRIPLIPK